MTNERQHVKIIAFVGLSGSGKSSAVEYLTQLDIPKVTTKNSDELISEITNLANAGQHTIAIDDISSIDTVKQIKHLFPTDLTVVAIVSSRHHRLQRENQLAANELDERDWKHVEHGSLGAVIALADHYIINDADLRELHSQVASLIH